MSTQLLIYESATPVSHARHGNWSVEVGTDYSFSRSVNSVPLMAVEFASAVSEYAIVFAGAGDVVMPAVILGMRADENLYLTKDGGWQARYIPAFLRRYPFVFASRDDGKTFTLCIDEGFRGFRQDGGGQKLFDEQRKPTPYVENVLKFLQQYQAEFRRTQAFCKKLKDLNLLEPMQAQVSFDGGEKMFLTGFSAVSRSRLKTLSAAALSELAQSDELELIYAHIASMGQFAAMRDKLASAKRPTAGTEEPRNTTTPANPAAGNGPSDGAAQEGAGGPVVTH